MTFDDGLKAYRSGDYVRAVEILAPLAGADPEARHLLGLSYIALGRADEAAFALEQVLKSQPDNSEAWSNFAAALRSSGQVGMALGSAEEAVRLDPTNAKAHNNLGAAWMDKGEFRKAEDAFSEALRIEPTYVDALCNLSQAVYELGRISESRQAVRTALALDPESWSGHDRMGFVQSAGGDPEAAYRSSKRAMELRPGSDRCWSNVLMRCHSALSAGPDEARQLAERWAERYAVSDAPPLPCRLQEIRRIGFVSGDLRNHPVGRFLIALVDRLPVECFAYMTSGREDAFSECLKPSFQGWRGVARWRAEDIAERILMDRIDVLVDLSGHTGDNRLDVFALAPAPVQLTWLGYPGTTGLPQMDGIIVDDVLAPTGTETQYSESLIRLPHSFLCLDEAPYPATVPKAEGVVFGVFNNPSKFSEECYRLWAEVLKAVPDSNVLFKYHYSGDTWVQSQIRGRLEDRGVAPERVRFLPYVEAKMHREVVASVHVALDTYPYSGATTTIDCLSVGVPVVTLTGRSYSSRMSASLLHACGFDDLVCRDGDDYVATARSLSDRAGALVDERAARIQAFVGSPLCDPDGFASGWMNAVNEFVRGKSVLAAQ